MLHVLMTQLKGDINKQKNCIIIWHMMYEKHVLNPSSNHDLKTCKNKSMTQLAELSFRSELRNIAVLQLIIQSDFIIIIPFNII